MSWGRVRIGEESFVAVEVVARAFRVEVGFVVEVVDLGLIAPGHVAGQHLYVPVAQMDRLAAIARWHFAFGVPLERVELVLRR